MERTKRRSGRSNLSYVLNSLKIGIDAYFQFMLRAHTPSLNRVVLREVMFGAQQLDVFGLFRRSSEGVRDYVVEMQILGTATLHAAPLIPLPYFQLNVSRDNAVILKIGAGSPSRKRHIAHLLQLEFEYLSRSRFLPPRIDQLKDSVVNPYSTSDLLKDSHSFRRGGSILEPSCCLCKQSILGWPTVRLKLGLVDYLGINNASCPWQVVPLIDDDASVLLDPILIWRS